MTTRELAAWLKSRMQDGRDLAFLVGGPDGFAPEVLTRSDFKWSLSRLTFPHDGRDEKLTINGGRVVREILA